MGVRGAALESAWEGAQESEVPPCTVKIFMTSSGCSFGAPSKK